MSEPLLSLRAVSRFQGERPVLRSLSLDISQGETILLLGANGAGKSTLLRILAGLGKADTGKVERKAGLRQAYLGHPTFLYPGLTAMQNLSFQAKIHGLKISESALLTALEGVGLKAYAHEQAKTFSRGMAQRLNFCRALLTEPELLLLDEPFTGMDSSSQRQMREELAARRQRGTSIVLASHVPELDAALADKILLLAKGKLERQC